MSSQMALDEITAFVRDRGQRSYWEDFTMRAWTVGYIKDLNAQGGDRGKPWVMDHLTSSFKGKKYQPKTPGAEAEVVLTFDELVRLWGLNRFTMNSMRKTARASRV